MGKLPHNVVPNVVSRTPSRSGWHVRIVRHIPTISLSTHQPCSRTHTRISPLPCRLGLHLHVHQHHAYANLSLCMEEVSLGSPHGHDEPCPNLVLLPVYRVVRVFMCWGIALHHLYDPSSCPTSLVNLANPSPSSDFIMSIKLARPFNLSPLVPTLLRHSTLRSSYPKYLQLSRGRQAALPPLLHHTTSPKFAYSTYTYRANMSNVEIPTEQWAQVCEQKGGRKSLYNLISHPTSYTQY